MNQFRMEHRKNIATVGQRFASCATFRKYENMSSQQSSQVKGLNRKLKQTEIDFMKLIEEQNLQRVLKLKQTRRNNIITGEFRKNPKISSTSLIFAFFYIGFLLGGAVFGIYAYSMFAVQQEKFLDDFDEPAKEEIKQ